MLTILFYVCGSCRISNVLLVLSESDVRVNETGHIRCNDKIKKSEEVYADFTT